MAYRGKKKNGRVIDEAASESVVASETVTIVENDSDEASGHTVRAKSADRQARRAEKQREYAAKLRTEEAGLTVTSVAYPAQPVGGRTAVSAIDALATSEEREMPGALGSLSESERSVGERLVTAKYPQRVPEWTRRVHEKTGHLGGMIVWALMNVLAWPLVLALLASLVQIASTQFVPNFGTMVAQAFSNDVGLLLGSQDRFMFSWVMPVLFMTMVLALVSYGVVKWIVGHGLRYSHVVADGLFAGYGRSLVDDLKLRRWDKSGRKVRAAEVKARRQREKAMKKKRAEDIAAAKKSDDRL